MARAWSGPEIEFLTRHLGEETKEIVNLFNEEFENRTYDSVQKKVKNLRDAFSDIQNEETQNNDFVVDEIEAVVEQQAPDLKIPHVTAAEKRAARQDAETWLREIVEYTRREISHISNVVTPEAVRSDKTTLVVVLSDLHFGKFTEYYSMEIGRQRLRAIPVELKGKALPEIDEVLIVLVGDVVEGEDIYATQNARIECPVIDQSKAASQAIWETILLFKQIFNCKIRVETAPGNHGRMSKTANEKSNWDNVVYHLVWAMAQVYNDPDIEIKVNFKQFNVFKTKGHKIGIYHEGVKHASTPAMREKIAGWAVSKDVDILCHGHWHEWHIGNWLGRIVVANGCLCGPDDLAEKMAKEDNARQAWFLLEEGKPPYGFSFLEWESSRL